VSLVDNERLGVTPTPDDGTRLSEVTVWDESARPAGPAAEPDTVYTERGQNNWTLGAFCENYCRFVTVHHSLEDVSFFPQVRRADPRLGPVLDRLSEEHRVIHEVLDRVDAALVATVSDPKGVAELGDAVDLLTDTLLSHLSYEERELVSVTEARRGPPRDVCLKLRRIRANSAPVGRSAGAPVGGTAGAPVGGPSGCLVLCGHDFSLGTCRPGHSFGGTTVGGQAITVGDLRWKDAVCTVRTIPTPCGGGSGFLYAAGVCGLCRVPSWCTSLPSRPRRWRP
jgi:hypothetical protein